jgi:hypothetical protein
VSDWLAGCGKGALIEMVGRMGIGISTKLNMLHRIGKVVVFDRQCNERGGGQPAT